jgi:putative DNA primase/helicase
MSIVSLREVNWGGARDISAALGGKSNGDGYVCPCPVPTHGKGRGDRNPSLSVKDGPSGPVLHCFSGCDYRDVRDELRARGLIGDERERYKPRSQRFRQQLRPAPKPLEPDPVALEIWKQAEPLDGTVAEQYLWRRGITLRPPMLCHHRGAMIAAVTQPYKGIIAIQKTPIDPNTLKRGKRLTFGSLHQGAVRLGAAARIMGLAEGTETALSAMMLWGGPVWSALGRRMHAIDLPQEVECVWLFGDNGEPGRNAVAKAEKAHRDAGRQVEIRFPPDKFSDFNDYLIARADDWQKE